VASSYETLDVASHVARLTWAVLGRLLNGARAGWAVDREATSRSVEQCMAESMRARSVRQRLGWQNLAERDRSNGEISERDFRRTDDAAVQWRTLKRGNGIC